jgi:8-oxo-dGTP pyrophosphatase MutT (NUDIX family)
MIPFGEFFAMFKDKRTHPKPGERGEKVRIHNPTSPTHKEQWHDSESIRSFPVNHPVPTHLNGVALTDQAPEPSLPHAHLDSLPFAHENQKKAAAGVLIVEPDHSVWVTEPTNHFGYRHTFPKGTLDKGEHMQVGAVRETHEETGLHVQLTGVLGDYDRSTSKCRYYIGKRVGGTPAAMGWETQAMHLVPLHQLEDHMHDPVDKQIARDLKTKLAQR